MISWIVALCLLVYSLCSAIAIFKIAYNLAELLAQQRKEKEVYELVNEEVKLPDNVVPFQSNNVFKELLIEFLEVEKKTDMKTYALTRTKVLQKAKKLLNMD